MTAPVTKTDATAEAERFLTGRGIAFERRPDGSLFIPGDVMLDGRDEPKLTRLPDLSMADVGGDFLCYQNLLTTLEGAPRTVGGDFTCSRNMLTTLKGAPRSVGGRFDCDGNRLTTLEHAPVSTGFFTCIENELTSLKGAPASVAGFNCRKNRLTSLEHAPRSAGGSFDCSSNELASLRGGPRTVAGYFNCHGNRLTSLRGTPRDVDLTFDCSWNRLRSLRGAPLAVESVFCEHNDLVSLQYLPVTNHVHSDFGKFGDIGNKIPVEIPEKLRFLPSTLARRGQTKQAQRDFKASGATVLAKPITVRPPLRFR